MAQVAQKNIVTHFNRADFIAPIYFGDSNNITGIVNFYNALSANSTAFQAGNATSAVTYTWPVAGPAGNGYSLVGTTAGVLSWSNTLSALTLTASRFIGGSAAPAVATGTGAGTNATSSVSGTDVSGTITVNTSNLDTPAANADIVTLTFNTTYGAAPRVIIQASNDATWNLAYGVFRYRQSDTTTGIFKIRSGATPLPATTTATYIFNYMVIQ